MRSASRCSRAASSRVTRCSFPAMTFVATFEAVTQAGLAAGTGRRARRRLRARPGRGRGGRRLADAGDHARSTCTASWPTCARSPRSPRSMASRSSRTPRRRTAHARRHRGGRVGSVPQRSASIRARTSARWATPVRSSPTTPRSPSTVRALREHGQRGSTTTSGRATPRASTRSRRSSSLASFRTSTAGTTSVAQIAGLVHGGLAGSRRPAATDGRRATRIPCGTSTSIRTAEPEALADLASRSEGSAPGATTPTAAAPDSGLRVARLCGGVVPGQRGARARVPLASDLPGHHGGAGELRHRRRSRVLRGWLSEPVNDAPYRLLHDVESGRPTSSSIRS